MMELDREFKRAFDIELQDFLNTRLYQYDMLVIDPDLLEDAIREYWMDDSDDDLENLILKYYGNKGLEIYEKLK